jgi:hypothetical protein
MKQKGPTWTTADGSPTLAKYVPAYVRLQETIGQRIATAVEAEEKRLRSLRSELIRLAQQVYRNNPDQGLKTSFTFYTFDREYRIVYDLQDFNIRVYRATKANPTSKDYEFIELSFSAFNADVVDTMEEVIAQSRPLSEPLIEGGSEDEPEQALPGPSITTHLEPPQSGYPNAGMHLPKDFNATLFGDEKLDTAMTDNNERAEEQARIQRELK